MTTISVPLNKDQMDRLDTLVQNGFAENKAAVMRRALEKTSENEAIDAVLRAQNEKPIYGDLRKIMNKMKRR